MKLHDKSYEYIVEHELDIYDYESSFDHFNQ